MSTLLFSLGRWSYRHPWRVLLAWLLILGVVGGGALVLNKGTDNSFTIPGTESQAGLEQLMRTFPEVSGTNAQILIIAAEGDSVSAEQYREPIEVAVATLAELPQVAATTSPFDEMIKGLVSEDEQAAILRLQFSGEATDVSEESILQLREITKELESALPQGAQTVLGGDLFAVEIPGLTLTEALGVLIALVVLIVTFRSFVVAGLPLLTALIGVGVSMAGILAATAFATVSSTTPLLALMLGLAVGIDYALFIIARHQDQVRLGMDPEESTARAVGTAGSAVVFAGVTVLIALIGLGFAGIPFLTTMGIAASVAVAIAVAVSLTLVPAFLGFIKGRVIGRVRKPKTPASKPAKPARKTPAHTWITLVSRHPVVTALAVVVALGAVSVPALSLGLALPNAGVLAEDNEARINYDLTAEHFGPGFNGPLILTGTIVTSTDPLGLMADLSDEVSKIPGVKTVALATPNATADTGIVQIIPATAPDDPATADLVREIRSHQQEWEDRFGIALSVTGFTAVAIDISDQLGAALIPFGIFVVGLSLVLLTIVFRSIWVPITAAVGYLLSIAAAFGVVGAVFGWGWFADLLHVARVGPIISFMPIILMGVLFGLAMDYQVFLVSRMREEFVHDPQSKDRSTARHAARQAVITGFTSTARVIAAAALIMFAVFVAFVPEGDSSLKPIALGLAAGIAIDAFLVRMTLIPALMVILGDHAWRLPRWLERILPRVDIEGEAVEHEQSLSNWPTDDSVIAADHLVLAGDSSPIAPLALRVHTGDFAIVCGGDELTRRKILFTIAGRLAPQSGQLRVQGHILPGRAAWVRSRVTPVLFRSSPQLLRDFSHALRSSTDIIAVEGLDQLSPDQRTRAIGALHRTVGTCTIVAFAQDAKSLQDLAAAAGWPNIAELQVDQMDPGRVGSAANQNEFSKPSPAATSEVTA